MKIPPGHKPPTNRRDFLRYGIIPFAGQVLMPGFVTQLLGAAAARADGDCAAPGKAGYIPFMLFDMAGGAALPGNFLVGKQGGPEDLCATYEQLGWNPRASGALDKSFGVPMARKESQILAGMRDGASPQALAKLRMGTICHFAQDDTPSNAVSALGLVSRAGLRGRFLPNGAGSINSLSGGNSDGALKEAQYKPLFVQHALDIQESTSHGPAFAEFSDDEIKSLSRVILELGAEQMRSFTGLGGGQRLSEIAACGYGGTKLYGKAIEGLDARADHHAAQVYQLRKDPNPRSKRQVFASIAYNVLKGNTGPGAITITGCDYHSPEPPEKGQEMDHACGFQIGRYVELAHRLGTPCFFQLSTDGGVSSDPGTRVWSADSNVRSLTVIGYYNPKGAPSQRRLQIGEYLAGGTVNQENRLVGGGPDAGPQRAANVVLANYLAACGKIGDFEKSGQGLFLNTDLDSVLIFG
jgi:hypothetical protein